MDRLETWEIPLTPTREQAGNWVVDLRICERRRLFGLPAGQIANAIAIAAVDNVSLACVHAEPVSQWKGFSPGMTGMRAKGAMRSCLDRTQKGLGRALPGYKQSNT
jgi:hypothetical protein